MPTEDGVDRFRDKEDKNTPLHILPSSSSRVTFIRYDIAKICCDCIVVEDNNDPAPDNVLKYEDVLPAPEKINFGFQDIDPWSQILLDCITIKPMMSILLTRKKVYQ